MLSIHGYGVGVHGNGGVGTGNVWVSVLLFSLASGTVLVESTVAVTGLLKPVKKTSWVVFPPNPLTVCVAPLTLTTKLVAAVSLLFLTKTRTPSGSFGSRQLGFCNSIRIVVIVRSARPIGVGVFVRLGVGDPVPVGVTLGVIVSVPVGVPVTLGTKVGVAGVPVPVTVGEMVSIGVGVGGVPVILGVIVGGVVGGPPVGF